MGDYLLELQGISKRFPGVLALDNVDFKLRPGTVHALMGENGAGKSTLMKCLGGIYQHDSGKILLNGSEVFIPNVRAALELGIASIQQELSPVLQRSVMDNIWMGREPLKNGIFVDHKKMYRDTKELLKRTKLKIDPREKMLDLTVANMQMVEISKAISLNAKIVIMDEPTSALSANEVSLLFKVIGELKADGVGIIYISHKIDEIFRIADDVTVLRDGRYISTHPVSETSIDQLITEMVGRNIEERISIEGRQIGQPVLQVEKLSSGAFQNVSFTLRKGEILGIAGLVGSGRTEILETIFGLRRCESGEMVMNGKKIHIESPEKAIKMGFAMITEERRQSGIVPLLDITENIMLPNYRRYSLRLGFIRKKKANADAEQYAKMLRVKTPSMSQVIQYLSGGNQQKVLLARWLLSQPQILLMDEPTRGIDVGAKSEIHNLMMEMVAQGKSIIMVSSELPEILKVSDRILVMSSGKIVGMQDRERASEESIMALAANK